MKKNKIDIRNYMDYRTYINDLVAEKRREGTFNFRSFCKKSGFASPTYLKWVMDGQRRISPDAALKFAAGLSLSLRSARHFELLVNYQETNQPTIKRFLFEELMKSRKGTGDSLSTQDRFEYLSHWYLLAIRELAALPDFSDNPRWIRQKLGDRLDAHEVSLALKILKKLKLIVRNREGAWRQSVAEVHTGPEVESLAAYNYHAEVLKQSADVLMKTSDAVREFSSLLTLVDLPVFLKIKEMMREFQEKVSTVIRNSGNGMEKNQRELYMLNMQWAPLTKFKENGFLKGGLK